MIIPGGEIVAVATGKCQWCGDEVSTGLAFKCQSCDRQRLRVQQRTVGVAGVEKGLTTCCRFPALETRGRWYCPACPGDDKVPIMLCHAGEEHVAYHLADTSVSTGISASGITVARLAEMRGVAPNELVLRITSRRSFRLRRLRDVDRRDLKAQVVVLRTKCEQCSEKIVRKVAVRSKGSVRFCEHCHAARRRAGVRRRRTRYRTSRAPRQCPECPRVRRFVGARCYGCARSLRSNGRCSCGKIMTRAYGGDPACLACVPLPRRRKSESVDVTVTDGEQFRTVQVAICSRVAGVRAQTWLAPVVLVDDMHRTNPRVGTGVAVSGVVVHGTGPSSRSVLPLFVEARSRAEVDAVARRELGMDSGRQVVVSLVAAGLVDKHGLTPRARAVLAWCRAAGVKL